MSVIIDNNLILSPPPDIQPLRHSRIGYKTWTRGRAPSDVTASSEASGFPADAPLRPDTYERWRPSSTSSTWEIDLGTARPVSYVGIGAHTIGTSGAAITVEYSDDAETWDEFGEFAPGDNKAIMFLAEEVEARYWRLSLEGGAPEIGVIYIGPVLAMERPIYGGHSPITLSRQTTLQQSKSRGGQFLGQQFRRKGLTGDANYTNLSPDWYRSEFDPFVKEARRFPFFFAWRPTSYPEEVAYVWTDGDIQPTNSGTRNFMDVSFSMVGFDE